MAKPEYSFIARAHNMANLQRALDNLRAKSKTFREVEDNLRLRYEKVVVVMGPNVTGQKDRLGNYIAACSGQTASEPKTWYVYINSTSVASNRVDAGSFSSMSVDQELAHELAHAKFEDNSGDAFGMSAGAAAEEAEVVKITDAISKEMGWPANTGYPSFSRAQRPVCTTSDPQGRDPYFLLFSNGSPADSSSIGPYPRLIGGMP